MKKIISILAFAALSAGAAQAGPVAPVYYGIASVGASSLSETMPDLAKSATNYQIGVGVQINRNFGAELAYTRSSRDISSEGVSSNAVLEGYSLVGTGAYPIIPSLDATAKIGMSNMRFKAMGLSNTDFSPLVGVGAEYRLNKAVSLTVDYTHQHKVAGMETDLEAVNVGVKYRF